MKNKNNKPQQALISSHSRGTENVDAFKVGPMMPVANPRLRPAAVTPPLFLQESRIELRAIVALA